MFEGPDFPASLDEMLFDEWLEKGRSSIIGYAYLLIVWDELDECYLPFYAEQREEIQEYARYGQSPENRLLVAAFDLYSENRII